ncbi:phosphotriesterase [Chloroflexota bacterium]
MRQTELAGKAQTVLGIIDPDSLGVTLPHEHLLTDVSVVYFIEPDVASERELVHKPVSLEILWWLRQHYFSNLDDMRFTDEDLAIKDALLYKWAGGSTIVELSNVGLYRDPLGLARISRATGLNIIMGSGYYVWTTHPPELASMTDEKIAEEIIRDIVVGVGNTGIRAGIIGEIGCSEPLHDDERKVLRAAAIAQRRTGAAINVHPSLSDSFALEIMQILSDKGADLSRTVFSHCDQTGYSQATQRKLMDAGCYLEHDAFGWEEMSPPVRGNIIDMPNDTKRINDIIQLIDDGYLNNILISGDHCFKHRLTAYGGYGYAHIIRDVTPMMLAKGISNEQIHTLMVENTKRMLTFVAV